MKRFLCCWLVVCSACTMAQQTTEQSPKGITVQASGAAGLLQPLASAAPQGNAGLFVGINKFSKDEGLSDLAYAVHDAIELAHLFVIELNLIPPESCQLLLSGQPAEEAKLVQEHLSLLKKRGVQVHIADRSQILDSFLKITDTPRDAASLLVCSFSSHGFSDSGQAWIMPSDGLRRLLVETAVSLSAIEDNMAKSKAGHRPLLVDACQERVSARGGTAAGTPAAIPFMNALKESTGQAKLASCSPGEFSFEHNSFGSVGHGVFTWYFLEALRGAAPADQDNIVRLGTVADYVARGVGDWARMNKSQTQTPFLQSPLTARELPLAARADDLTSLKATVEHLQPDEVLTPELLKNLAAAVSKVDLQQPVDREFLQSVQDYSKGKFTSREFARIVKPDIERLLSGTPTPMPTTTPAPVPTPNQKWLVRVRVQNLVRDPQATLHLKVGSVRQSVPPGHAGFVEAVAPFTLEYSDRSGTSVAHFPLPISPEGPAQLDFTRNEDGPAWWKATPVVNSSGITRSAVSNVAAEPTPRFFEFTALPAPPATTPTGNPAASGKPATQNGPKTGWTSLGMVNGVQVFRDNSTGLEWTQTLARNVRFNEASNTVRLSGFRLPTPSEFQRALQNNMARQSAMGYDSWFFWTSDSETVMSIENPKVNPARGLLNDGTNSVRGVRNPAAQQ
jgi:uncharacterized caspase-like protein